MTYVFNAYLTGFPVEFCKAGAQKTRMMPLPDGLILMTCELTYIQYHNGSPIPPTHPQYIIHQINIFINWLLFHSVYCLICP